MTFVPSQGVGRFTISGLWGAAEEVVNVVHLQRKNDGAAAVWTVQDLLDASNRLAGAWSQFLAGQSNQLKWTEVQGRDLSSEHGTVSLLTINLTGANGSAAFPPSVAVLVRWKTGIAGRGANGRSFMVGMAEAEANHLGMLDSGPLADWGTRATQARTFLGAATDATHPGPPLDMVIVHKPNVLGTSRPRDVVVAHSVSSMVASQRRRLPRRP